MSRKIVLLALLYISIPLGLAGMLWAVIVLTNGPQARPTGWQLQTLRLVLPAQGQLVLPPSSAFAVQKGQLTLLIHPRIDQSGFESRLYNPGSAFATWSGRRYSLVNAKSGAPVDLLVVQAVRLEGDPATFATALAGESGASLELLEQLPIAGVPASEELEQFVLAQSLRLR